MEPVQEPWLTKHGNYLLDISFKEWPEQQSILQLKMIQGIIDTSLFCHLFHRAVTGSDCIAG